MSSYNKIIIYPNQTIDYLMQLKDVANDEDISMVNNPTFLPDWNNFKDRTDIMANYTDSLVSSYITGLTENLSGWDIYREKIGENKLVKVGEVSKDITYIDDYCVSNQTSYKYHIFPLTANQIGVNLESQIIATDWWDWSLTSVKKVSDIEYIPQEVWLFDTNLNSGTITQNIDIVYHKNFTKYPKEAKGEMNYFSGTLSCLLSNVDNDIGEYVETIDKLKRWRAFCSDGNLKILKDRKGNIRLVSISDITSSYLDESEKQPTTISFSYTEVGDIDEISVYEEVI